MQLNVVWNSLGTTHSLEHMTTLLCQPGLPHPILLLVFQRHRHYCILQWVPPSSGHHPPVGISLQWVPPSCGPFSLFSLFPYVSTFGSPGFTTVLLLSLSSTSPEKMALLSLCLHSSLTCKHDSLRDPPPTLMYSPHHTIGYMQCFFILVI